MHTRLEDDTNVYTIDMGRLSLIRNEVESGKEKSQNKGTGI